MSRFISRLLREDDDVLQFESGVTLLDNWFATQAIRIGFVPTKDDSEKPALRYLTIADAKRTLAEVR